MRLNVSTLAAAGCALLLAIPVMAAMPSARRNAWPAETLSGMITMVEPGEKLLVVEDTDGVPFDIVVTGKTRIESGGHAISLKDLQSMANKGVSIRFIPERRGDVAASIRITS